MFSGGGLAWAEGGMKAGDFALEPSPPDVRPDLTGLSCRFDEIKSTHGVILSLIVVPAPAKDAARFEEFLRAILQLAEGGAEVRSPVPVSGPRPRWPPSGFELEARASPLNRRSPWAARLWVGKNARCPRDLQNRSTDRRLRSGALRAAARPEYGLPEIRRWPSYDPRLHLGPRRQVEALLATAEALGIARSGTHRQDAALMTCFVPSPNS